MSINDRIKAIRTESGKTQEEFSVSIGLKRGNYAQIESGKQNPTIETITSIVRIYNKSYDYVIDGKGGINDTVSVPSNNVIVGEKSTPKSTPNYTPNSKNEQIIQLSQPKILTVDSMGNENIVYVPIKAAAGYLNGYGDPQWIERLPTYRIPGFDHGTFRMFEINGHSMMPTFKNRDKIVGKWCELKDVKDSYVHVVVTKTDGVVVKRVLNRLNKDGVLILKSDGNRYEYPDMIVDAEDIIEVWSGAGKFSRDLSGPNDLFSRLDDAEGRLALIESLLKASKTPIK